MGFPVIHKNNLLPYCHKKIVCDKYGINKLSEGLLPPSCQMFSNVAS